MFISWYSNLNKILNRRDLYLIPDLWGKQQSFLFYRIISDYCTVCDPKKENKSTGSKRLLLDFNEISHGYTELKLV